MKPALCVAMVVLVWPTPAFAQKLQGRLAIGADVFAVTGQVATEPTGTVRLSLDLSRTGKAPDHSLVVLMTPKGGQATVDGYSFPLPAQVVTGWSAQVRHGLAPDISQGEFVCRAEAGGGRTCDSRGLVMLGRGLPGRLRLSYNGDRLIGVRFFSLAEWNNRFQDYVSLSLDIR